ncbi:hypothetical protein ABT237_33355 [Streptomyces sp. NPDC001581]|uniref:hypothetical protein n=1 Tax=Streptomyces sp. NPDC001581 TaxID=3154386 RepID=UPI00332D57EA
MTTPQSHPQPHPQSTPRSHLPLPYEETTDPRYAQEVAQNHDLQHVKGDDYVFVCTCPRRGAALDIPLFDPEFRTSPPGNAQAGAAGSQSASNPPVPMSCTCQGTNHDGRPEGRSGCGAFWALESS